MRALHLNTRLEDPVLPSKMLEQSRKVTENFYGLLMERVHELVMKPNKLNEDDQRNIKVDDIVMFLFTDSDAGDDWRTGRVIDVKKSSASIVYVKKNEKGKVPVLGVVERPIRRICILHSEEDIDLNTEEHRRLILDSMK